MTELLKQALRDWKNAELWVRRVSERYAGSTVDYYLWCRRTGRGDLTTARELALSYFKSHAIHEDIEKMKLYAVFHLLEGDPKSALPLFEQAFQVENAPYAALHTALLQAAANDVVGRDATLKKIVEIESAFEFGGRATQDLTNLFVKCLANGPDVKLDSEKIDRILAEASLGERTNLLYFVGKFLELRQETEQAEKYYKLCALSPDPKRWNRILAWVELRAGGIEPTDLLHQE